MICMCWKSLTCIHVHCMVVYDVITRLQECTTVLVQRQRLPFTSMVHDSTQKRSKMTYSFRTSLQFQASNGEVSYWKCLWYFETNIYRTSKKTNLHITIVLNVLLLISFTTWYLGGWNSWCWTTNENISK
jgi:hypothetical protein